jgi:hypothetical protein
LRGFGLPEFHREAIYLGIKNISPVFHFRNTILADDFCFEQTFYSISSNNCILTSSKFFGGAVLVFKVIYVKITRFLYLKCR